MLRSMFRGSGEYLVSDPEESPFPGVKEREVVHDRYRVVVSPSYALPFNGTIKGHYYEGNNGRQRGPGVQIVEDKTVRKVRAQAQAVRWGLSPG